MTAPLGHALAHRALLDDPSPLDARAQALAAWSDRPARSKAPRTKTIPDSAWEKAKREAAGRMESGEWEGALPRVIVALYALLHERVYGVEAGELTSVTRVHAAGAAARMLDLEFGGDADEFAEFMRWTWAREKGREDWRRANNRDGGRIGWRLQFTGGLMTDYRLALARSRSQGAP